MPAPPLRCLLHAMSKMVPEMPENLLKEPPEQKPIIQPSHTWGLPMLSGFGFRALGLDLEPGWPAEAAEAAEAGAGAGSGRVSGLGLGAGQALRAMGR